MVARYSSACAGPLLLRLGRGSAICVGAVPAVTIVVMVQSSQARSVIRQTAIPMILRDSFTSVEVRDDLSAN